jgi:Fibronectin type III domain
MKIHETSLWSVSSLPVLAAVAVVASVLLFAYSAFAVTSSPIMPTSDGTYTQWTPSTGMSHFALVDEAACNGTTDYNSTTVVGNRDSYGVSLASVPNGATITQISIKPCASRALTGGTNPVMNVFYRANGINSADAGAYSLTGTTPAELATTTYSGLSMIKGSTTTLEAGAVLTSSTRGARLSRIATTITYTPITAPTNLVGTATTSSQIRLTWTATSSVGYNVERSTNAVNWTNVATTSNGVSQYYDVGLSASTTYYHRVRAYNSGGTSAYTNIATTTTADVPPSAPSDLSLTTQAGASSTTDIILNWIDNSSNELGFKVERSVGTSTFSQIATTSVNVVTYTDASKTSGTYTYRLRAYNNSGNSAYSNTASTTIQ